MLSGPSVLVEGEQVVEGEWQTSDQRDAYAPHGGVLYITEEMLRRYSDPHPVARMACLKVDGSRRVDKIRSVDPTIP